MSCIYKNPLNTSNPSELHRKLTELYATQQEADDMYAIVSTKEFINQFGDWTSDFTKSERLFIDRTYASGEPEIKFNSFGLPYFEMLDGDKLFLDRRILNIEYEQREYLVNATMFKLFGNNLTTDSETFENVNINSIFTDQSEGSIYDILDGNIVDLTDIKRLVVQKLNQMQIKVVEKEDLNNPDGRLNREEVENTKVIDLRTSQERNSKDNSTSNIKFLLSFIPTTDHEGRPIFAKFDEVWKKIEPVLSNTVDLYREGNIVPKFEIMMDKLNQTYPNDEVIQQVITIVEKMPNWKQNEFVQAFDKNKNIYQTSLVKKIGEDITFKSFDSDRAVTPAKKNIATWNANFKGSSLISIDNNGNPSLSTKEGITTANRLYNSNTKGYKVYLEKVRKLNPIKDMDETLFEELNTRLNFVGITIDTNGLREYIHTFNTGSQVLTNSMLLSASIQLDFIFKELAKLTNNDVIKGLNIKNIYSTKGFNKQLNALGEAQAKYRQDLTESTIIGAESKKYWIYSLPSYLTNKLERLKLDAKSELPINKPYYEYSIILNKFRNNLADPALETEYIKNLELLMFNNFRQQNEGDEGSDNSSMLKQDQIVDNINKTLNAIRGGTELSVYYTPIPADKSKLYHIKGSHFFRSTRSDNAYTLSNDVLFVFENYLIDEINRTQEELKLLNNIEGNKDRLYKDYHYKLGKDGKPYYYDSEGKPVGNAFKSILFPQFSPFNLSEEVSKMNIFDSSGKLLKNVDILRNNKDIRRIINDDIQNTVTSQYNSLESQDLIVDNKQGIKKIKALDKDIFKEYEKGFENDDAIRAAVSDYVVNSIIANVEFGKVFSGDPAFYKDLSDLSKRYPATYTDGINLNLKKGDNPNFELTVLPNVILPSYALEEIKNYSPALAKAYSEINTTDAQGYITLDRWKFIMERSNHWNPSYESAYQRIKDGNPTAEDYKYAAQPIKGVHFEHTDGIPTYIKYSAAVLIPNVIKNTDLGKLYNDMVAQEVDEAVVVDGIKVGAKVPSDILGENGVYISGKLNSITLRNNNYKIQQDLRPKGIKSTLLGSQIKKIILTNFKDNEEYSGILGKDLKQEFFDILSAKSNFGLKKLQKELGIDPTGTIVNKQKLTTKVLTQISSRGITENLSNALQKEYDFDYIANQRQKIQNSIMSIINDATVNVKTNGAAFIQTSSWGLNSTDIQNSGIKLLVDDYKSLKPPVVYIDKDEKERVAPGQVFVTSNYISKFIPDWEKLSPEELRSMIDSRLLRMIGYRIPNQGMSSNASLQIVGILPESYGDTIIPYIDITTQTGSDFDIDKMYVMIPSARAIHTKATYKQAREFLFNRYKGSTITDTTNNLLDLLDEYEIQSDPNDFVNSIINKSNVELLKDTVTEIIEKILFENTILAEDFNTQYGINKLQRLEYRTYEPNVSPLEQSQAAVDNRLIELMQIILEDEKTYDALMSPLDNPFLKNDINYLHGTDDNKDIGSLFFAPLYQIDKKFDNSGGKTGVGLTANQLTDHMWTQHIGLQYVANMGFTNTKNGITTFDGEMDILNENKITDVLSWFLTAYVDIAKDPYITKGNHNEYTSNTTFMLLRAGAPISFINRLVGQPAIMKLAQIDSLRKSRIADIDRRNINDAVIEELGLVTSKEYFSAEKVIERFNKSDNQAENIKKYNEIMEKDIKNPNPNDDAWKARQLEYLDLYNYYHKIGKDFSALVLSSKQDVNGGGKDFISAYTDRNKRNEAAGKNFINFMSKFNNTFLGTAYENSTELSIRIMEQLFVTSNKSAQILYDSVYKLISPNAENGLVESKLGFEMEKSYFAHILGQTNMARNNAEIKEMFIGTNTVYDKLLQVRANNPDNYFLNLLTVDQVDGIKFVMMDSTKNNSTEALNEISRTWEDLLNSDKPSEVNLANDLIVYSFYQSGFRSNIGSFFEHIPIDKLKEIVESGIAEAKVTYTGGNIGINQFVDKFFRNNWQNDRIVPYAAKKLRNGNKAVVTGVLTVLPDNGTERGKHKMPYLKTSTTDGFGIKQTTLWKNMGYLLDNKGKITSAKFIKVSKLGYNDNGRSIYEYTKSIPVDGDSMWNTNNIVDNTTVREAVLKKLESEGQLYNVITDDRAIYYTTKINTRNQNEDMIKANKENLINCIKK